MRFVASYRSFAIAAVATSLPLLAQVPVRVDLTQYQTPLRLQGNRNTCQTFAAVAALEARYRRIGYTLDLSEEFVNHIGKMMWLDPNWSAANGASARENQVGAFGGGGGWSHLRNMCEWMRVPIETLMPYQPQGYTVTPWNSTFWNQRNANSFNLDPSVLPRAALTAAHYYSATGYTRIPDAQSRSPSTIEAVLRQGYEVVWDFDVNGNRSGSIWRSTTANNSSGGHVMLIVGYDRSAGNNANNYFLVKNSWGPTSNPGGYTYISYDYLINYGQAAGYITGAATPGPWPEIAAMGRRNFSFDGWRGTLDIYHLPGAAQSQLADFNISTIDRRLGTFFDSNGTAYRVNGTLAGNLLTFWFKNGNPNMTWDEQRSTPLLGRQFVYYLTEYDGASMAGIHWDNAGNTPNPTYGGYARMPSTINGSDGFLRPSASSHSTTPEQFLGSWRLMLGNREYELIVDHRDDNLVSSSNRGRYAGFSCQVSRGGSARWATTAEVELANTRRFRMTLVDGLSTYNLDAYMLNWQRGVFAGRTSLLLVGYSYWAERLGDHQNGAVSTFGSSCGPTGARPVHSVTGYPEVGESLTFQATGVPSGGVSLLSIGLSNTSSGSAPLPLSLAGVGAPGCFLRVDPIHTQLGFAFGTTCAVSVRFTQPALLGQRIYSQFFTIAPAANGLGMTASNGARVLLGGVR